MKIIWNMKPKAMTSGAHLKRGVEGGLFNQVVKKAWGKKSYLAIVVDNCCMVLLKEMYLNTFSHAKKTLIAKTLFCRSFHQARVVKSPEGSHHGPNAA